MAAWMQAPPAEPTSDRADAHHSHLLEQVVCCSSSFRYSVSSGVQSTSLGVRELQCRKWNNEGNLVGSLVGTFFYLYPILHLGESFFSEELW